MLSTKLSDTDLRHFVTVPLFDKSILMQRDPSFPRISIVIPSYNKGPFIERTILSVLNQNYPNLECIVIDGGSTDGTLEVLERYRPYLVHFSSERDRGQSDALNKGFQVVTGDLVNEQDADDVFLPEAFHEVARTFQEHPTVDVFFGNRLDIDEQGRIIGRCVYTRFSPTVYRYDGMCIGPQSAFWKRDLFDRFGMYDESLHLAMDYDFFMRAALGGARFKYLPFYFSAMRRYGGSKTTAFLDTPAHREEWDLVNRRYGKKQWLAVPLKLYALLHRALHYIAQGDGDYVWAGLARRLRRGRILSGV